MLKTQEKEIDGMTFAVSQLPPRRAFKVLRRLGRIFGSSLGELASSVQTAKGLGDLDLASVGSALGAMFQNMSDEDVDVLCNELLASSTVTTGAGTMALLPQVDLLLMGRVDSLLKVLWFAVEVNYGSFYDAARSFVAQAAKAPSPPNPPTA